MMVLAPNKRNQSICCGRRLSVHVGKGGGYARIDIIAVSFTARTIHSPFTLTLAIDFVARVAGLHFS
jgi:hypothetical protein